MINPEASPIVATTINETVEPDHQNSIAPSSENDEKASGNADQDDGLGPWREDVSADPPMGFPLPESNRAPRISTKIESRNRESNPISAQSPATRSNFHQTIENKRQNSIIEADSSVWVTQVGHNAASDDAITLLNRAGNRAEQLVTRLGHKRSVRGLSLRGSIYQFRVRVPADLREAMGSSHVKRSLRTDSSSLAIRLSRKFAFEIEAMFEQKRQEII
jgi:hypothetical protein